MTSNRRSLVARDQAEILPGLPDVLPATPPKAREYEALTLDEAITRSHELLDEVLAAGRARAVFALFSGGGDSSILAHLMRDRVDALVHVDTGIAIPATGVYVRAVAKSWGVPLITARPPDSYEDLVMGRVTNKAGKPVWSGFPGPAGHYLMYVRLKERALDAMRREMVGRRGKAGELVFLAGMRWGESDRRFRNAEEIDHDGAVTWCSPIVYWTAGHVAEYRARFMCNEPHEHAEHRLCRPDGLPLSEVSEHLHVSGDCLCGAFAREGELDEIGFFYPDTAARVRALEAEARAAGIARCKWGPGRDPRPSKARQPGRLCSSCVEMPGQASLVDGWVAAGLLTAEQAAAMQPPE